MPIEVADEPMAPVVADKVTTAIATLTTTNVTFTELRAKAQELAERYRSVVWDVRTVKGMDDACKARMELREVRYTMQKLQTGGKRMLNDLKRDFDGRADELIAEVAQAEEPIDTIIKMEEERKENERRAREEAEAARVQGHLTAIASISGHVAAAVGETSAEIAARITGLDAMDLGSDSWEEFSGQAIQAHDEAVRQLNGLLIAARAEEAELEEARAAQARLREAQAAESARLEQEREAQAARQRELDAQAESLRQQQEAMAAQQRALDEQAAAQARERELRAHGVQSRIDAFAETARLLAEDAEATSADIAECIERLGAPISSDQYDARVSDAIAARDAAVAELAQLRIERAQAEAEEARQKRAAEVQARLDDIRGMGENAEGSVSDGGSINPEHIPELRDGLLVLHDLADMDADALRVKFDDRATEAAALVLASITRVAQAIAALEAADARIAAEAEERRKQEVAQAAARALDDTKRAMAGELYESLRAMVLEYQHEASASNPTLLAAKSLLVQINPKETFDA